MILLFIIFDYNKNLKIDYYKILLHSYINQDLFYLDDLEILKS